MLEIHRDGSWYEIFEDWICGSPLADILLTVQGYNYTSKWYSNLEFGLEPIDYKKDKTSKVKNTIKILVVF